VGVDSDYVVGVAILNLKRVLSILKRSFAFGGNHLPEYNTYNCVFLLCSHLYGWRSRRRKLGRTILSLILFQFFFSSLQC